MLLPTFQFLTEIQQRQEADERKIKPKQLLNLAKPEQTQQAKAVDQRH